MADDGVASRFTFAEFFSGIGGFRLALEAAGGQCVFACEYCHFAQATYRQNWPRSHVVGDIHRIDAAQVPRHDVLAAGFPCQSFSNAGRLGRLADERGQLFYELIRIIGACRPRALLLENVRGLLTHDETLAEVLRALADAGYPDMHVAEMDAASVVPQRRRRVYLVGFRCEAARAAYSWPRVPALRRAAESILEERAPAPTAEHDRCAVDADADPAASAASPNQAAFGQSDGHVALLAALTLSHDKWSKVTSSAYFAKFPGSRLLAPGAIAQTLQTTYKSGYLLYSQFVPTVRLDGGAMAAPACGQQATGGSASIVAGTDGASGESEEVMPPPPRFFSPRECARLMGFPESFQLPAADGLAHRQLGNAVVPPLVAAIAVSVVSALEAAEDDRSHRADNRRGYPSCDVDDAARRAAIQCEATAASLALALDASPTARPPRVCWLHADAYAALPDTVDDDIASGQGSATHADTPGRYSASVRPDAHGGYAVAVTLDGLTRAGERTPGVATASLDAVYAAVARSRRRAPATAASAGGAVEVHVTIPLEDIGPAPSSPGARCVDATCDVACEDAACVLDATCEDVRCDEVCDASAPCSTVLDITHGADYHAPLDADWVGPLAIVSVLQRARAHAHGRRARSRLPVDTEAPIQTLPDPTTELKRLVAAQCMRKWTTSQMLVTCQRPVLLDLSEEHAPTPEGHGSDAMRALVGAFTDAFNHEAPCELEPPPTQPAPLPTPDGRPPLGSILQLAKETGRPRKECEAALVANANDFERARRALS